MFKACLKNYLIAVGILVLVFVSFFGYRAYQGNRDFEDFMSGARAFQQSIDKDTLSSDNTEDDTEGEHHANDFQEGDSIPTVKVMKHKNTEPGPNSRFFPADEDMKSKRSFTPAEMVKKRVRTPDGETHTIWLPPGYDVKDGAGVSEDLLNRLPPPNFEVAMAKGIGVKNSDVPEGESIHSHISDRFLSNLYGISVEEVRKRRESGDVLMQVKHIEIHPVEEFIDNEPLSRPVPENASAGGTDEDASGATDRPDVPISPSNHPDMVKPTPSPPSVADIEKQLTPQGIEAELNPEVSLSRKVQQLIDQYGTEEGLRRLRESDPEAARQFERERRPVPSHDVPNGGQSESGSQD